MLSSGGALGQVSISTADGGADTYVRLGQATNNFGGATFLPVKYTGSNTNTTIRKAYLRFSLAGLTGVFGDASLSLTVTSNNGGGSPLNTNPQNFTFNIYGLNDSAEAGGGFLGEDWDESSINWNNAPANIVSGVGAGNAIREGDGISDGGHARLIGTFEVTSSDTAGASVIAATAEALVDFLNDDTNGLVTFIVTRTGWSSGGGSPAPNQGSSNVAFASKESGDGSSAPRLTGNLVPELPFAITSIEYPTIGNGAKITWRASPGRTYKVQTSPDLADWSEELIDNWPPGGATGDSAFYEDKAIPVSAAKRFYRVLEEPLVQ